jgi:hypothetical protein
VTPSHPVPASDRREAYLELATCALKRILLARRLNDARAIAAAALDDIKGGGYSDTPPASPARREE